MAAVFLATRGSYWPIVTRVFGPTDRCAAFGERLIVPRVGFAMGFVILIWAPLPLTRSPPTDVHAEGVAHRLLVMFTTFPPVPPKPINPPVMRTWESDTFRTGPFRRFRVDPLSRVTRFPRTVRVLLLATLASAPLTTLNTLALSWIISP